jgi:hypothetical protein
MRSAILAAVLLALSQLPAGAVDEPPPPHAHAAQQAYSPGLGEIMTLQQMRHAKLWLAGKARNWELAAYEVDELKEGFGDAAKLFPTHDGVPIAQMIDEITKTSVADLEKAVGAKNDRQFAAAFDQLTGSCNACHQAAKHGFIVIARPTSSPFPNQVFAPAKK